MTKGGRGGGGHRSGGARSHGFHSHGIGSRGHIGGLKVIKDHFIIIIYTDCRLSFYTRWHQESFT